jgi:hypothetical protein
MPTWTNDQLTRIGAAEELQIASLRADGTLGSPVTIWGVRLGAGLYVRSVNGHSAAWFRRAQARHEGRIWAGGVENDVTFLDIPDTDTVQDEIDAAYRAKYRRYPSSMAHIVSPTARSATIRLEPRADGA